MKQLFKILIFSLYFIFQPIYSQSNFQYGIKFGLSGSNFILSDTKPTGFYNPKDYYKGNSINPTLGIFLDYRINKNLFFETELSYLQKGTRFTEETNVSTFEHPDGLYKSDYTYSFDIRYLEFGMILKPTIKFSTQLIYLIVGPSINYTLNAMNLIHVKLQKSVFSYKFGVGTELQNIISVPVLFEIKYLGDFSYFYNYEYGKFKNQAIVFNVGIKFR